MNLGNLGLGEKVAAAAAVLLVLSMLVLGWYTLEGASVEGPGGQTLEITKDQLEESDEDTSGTAFEAFELIDILLLVAAIVVVGGVLMTASGRGSERVSQVVAIAGVAAFVVVLFRVVVPPDLVGNLGEVPEGLEVDIDVGRGIGGFVGLLLAAGMAYGGYLMTRSRTRGADEPRG